MKTKKPNLNSSLEELETDSWGEPGEASSLVHTIHRLRKKPLREFTIEDLRISIGQQVGLDYLIPLAIGKLSRNILAAGDYYPGDLLKNVLEAEAVYWEKNKSNWIMVRDLVNAHLQQFEPVSDYKNIMLSFERFKQIDKFND